MNPFFQHYRSINRMMHGVGILGCVGVISLLIFIHHDIQSKREQTEMIESKASALLQKSEEIVAHHHALEKQVKASEIRAVSLKTRIPKRAGEIDFMSQLSRSAESTEFRIRDFRPGAVVAQSYHHEMEVRFVGEGSYVAFCQFLNAFNTLPRVYRISQMMITAPREESGAYVIEFHLQLIFNLNQTLDSEAAATS